VAHASHVVLYALMFALPLVGWGMLSAARYHIVLYGPLQMPPILPHDASLYAMLRTVHTALAFLLFATFIAHFSAALMHALIYRDGVFPSMASFGRQIRRHDRTHDQTQCRKITLDKRAPSRHVNVTIRAQPSWEFFSR
jgi:thiosulfate reductase cytochrome b subunit